MKIPTIAARLGKARVRVAYEALIVAVAATLVHGCGGGGTQSAASSSKLPSGPPANIVGALSAIVQSGNSYQLTGWACAPDGGSISVNVYAGGALAAGGTSVGVFAANLPTSATGTSACGSASPVGFSIPLTVSVLGSYGASPVYAYGVGANGVANPMAFGQSGALMIPQLIWFSPLFSFVLNSAGNPVPYEQVDYFSLFTADSPWPMARSHTQVFDIVDQSVSFGTDEQLQSIFSYLKANNIALSLGIGPLEASAQCGQGVEGFTSGPAHVSMVAQRIQSLGGELAFVDMDEPLFYGHYYTGTNACQYPVATLAQQAAATMQAVKAVFPNVQIGDVEPLNSFANSTNESTWQSTYQAWITDFQSAAGFPLVFFHDDATWSVPLTEYVPQLQALLKQNQMSFGMLFDGTDNAVSDAAWMAAAEEHIQAYNSTGNAQPAQVVIDTFDPYPTHALPETSPTAQSYLVDFYFSSQAQLSPVASVSQDEIILAEGAVVYRSTCSLSALGALSATPTNVVNYAYCLLQARQSDPGGLQSYTTQLTNGSLTLQQMMDNFYNSEEFQDKYGVANMTNAQFVSFLYALLFFEAPDPTGLATYTSNLGSGAQTRQQVFDALIVTPAFISLNPILSAL